jgi:hypothetical protein
MKRPKPKPSAVAPWLAEKRGVGKATSKAASKVPLGQMSFAPQLKPKGK